MQDQGEQADQIGFSAHGRTEQQDVGLQQVDAEVRLLLLDGDILVSKNTNHIFFHCCRSPPFCQIGINRLERVFEDHPRIAENAFVAVGVGDRLDGSYRIAELGIVLVDIARRLPDTRVVL